MYYRDAYSLLLKVKTDDLLNDFENGKHISSRMDSINWNESIYTELVNCQAPNQLLFLLAKTGSDLISHSVLSGPKVNCLQTHNDDNKSVYNGCRHTMLRKISK